MIRLTVLAENVCPHSSSVIALTFRRDTPPGRTSPPRRSPAPSRSVGSGRRARSRSAPRGPGAPAAPACRSASPGPGCSTPHDSPAGRPCAPPAPRQPSRSSPLPVPHGVLPSRGLSAARDRCRSGLRSDHFFRARENSLSITPPAPPPPPIDAGERRRIMHAFGTHTDGGNNRTDQDRAVVPGGRRRHRCRTAPTRLLTDGKEDGQAGHAANGAAREPRDWAGGIGRLGRAVTSRECTAPGAAGTRPTFPAYRPRPRLRRSVRARPRTRGAAG